MEKEKSVLLFWFGLTMGEKSVNCGSESGVNKGKKLEREVGKGIKGRAD